MNRLLVVLCLVLLRSHLSDGWNVVVDNNGPVVWGSKITFHGALYVSLNTSFISYVWEWDDGHSGKVEQDGGIRANFTTSYEDPGNYTMSVRVKVKVKGYNIPIIIASTTNQFAVLDTIPGALHVYLGNGSEPLPENHYTSTTDELHFNTSLYDPEDFLANASLFYLLNVNNVLITSTGPNFKYTFSEPNDYRVMVIVSAYMTPASEGFRWASYETFIKVREPIRKINITGNTTFKRGDMLSLTADCDGSSPWNYCWKAIDNDNATAQDMTCTDFATTNMCEFHIFWYFKDTGSHKVLINISNDINQMFKVVPINIFVVLPEPQLSVIIIPVLCSLLAIAIMIVGLFYFIQTRRRFIIEVADFDFTSSDSVTYQTFCEQLKYAIMNALPNSSDLLCDRSWNFLDCRTDLDASSTSTTSSMQSELKLGEANVEVATAMALP